MRPKKPYPNSLPNDIIGQAREHHSPASGRTDAGLPGRKEFSAAPPPNTTMQRTPDKLPDPWIFNSEKLLRELDRCREMVLLIPAPTHETHFAINNAVNAIWDLRETLRYLLSLHRDMQRSFATKGEALTSSQLNPRRDPPTPRYARWEKPARRAKEKESIAPQAGAGHNATA